MKEMFTAGQLQNIIDDDKGDDDDDDEKFSHLKIVNMYFNYDFI